MTTIEIPDYTKWVPSELIFALAGISGQLLSVSHRMLETQGEPSTADCNELDELSAHHDAIIKIAEDRGYTMKWSDMYHVQMFTWVENGKVIDMTDHHGM